MMEYKNTFGEKVLKKYLEEEVSEKNGLDESASKPLEKVYAGDEQGYEDDEEMEYLKETDPTNIEMQETENTIQHLEI